MFDYIVEIEKFNEHHDPKTGRFTNKPGGEAGFVPARDRREAYDYAENALGFSNVNYGTTLFTDDVNRINKQITEIQEKYPETKGMVDTLKVVNDASVRTRLVTYQDGSMTLEINEDLYKDGGQQLEAMYKKGVETGFYPQGTSGESALWHEYGHVLANASALNQRSAYAKDFYDDRKNGFTEFEWLENAMEAVDIYNLDDFAGQVSRYAMHDTRELFAESFSQVMTADNPSKAAVAMVEASGWNRDIKKGNPWHDPATGRFTNKPGGGKAGSSTSNNTKTISGQYKDVDAMNEYEYYVVNEKTRLEDIKKLTGVDDSKAREYLDALCGNCDEYTRTRNYSLEYKKSWFYGQDREIRAGKTEEGKRKAEIIHEYIEKAPKFEGEIYRGLSLSQEMISGFKKGAVFKENGTLSSWSSSKDVAMDVAAGRSEELGMRPVIISTKNPEYGTPVAHLSMFGNWEQEVLVSNMKESRYTINGVEERDGMTYVELTGGVADAD